MLKYFVYFFTLVSGIGIIVTSKKLFYASMSKSWKKSRAEIIESDIGTEWTDTDSARKYYRPTIRYKYTFEMKIYENDNYNFLIEDLSKMEAQALIKNYQLGKEIDIFVNPFNPRISVIEPGLRGMHILVCALCGGLFSGLLYCLFKFNFFLE
jgi:hypothetical protein